MKRLAIITVFATALAFALVAIRAPKIAAQAWFCAFVLISMIPIGSLALLLIHGITGGRWGKDLSPALIPAASCIPLLLFAVLPVLVLRPLVYDWTKLDLPADVLSAYLTPAFFDVRTLIALAAWSALVWLRAWTRPVTAASGAVVHLILLSLIPADWLLTLAPGGVSAGFGFGFGCEQIFAALGFAAVTACCGVKRRANRDLAGILVTALLATMYFIYMQYLIVWYGNTPNKVEWYVVRAENGWEILARAAFASGVVVPFLALLSPNVRRSASLLRLVGVFVLLGVGLHVIWIGAPAFGAIVLPAVGLAVIGLAVTFTLLVPDLAIGNRQ